MKKYLGIGLGTLALVAALTGCAGTSGTTTTAAATADVATQAPGTTAAAASPSSAASSGATANPAVTSLKTASSSAGQIVVDGKGMSLYFFTKDVKDSGSSACAGACTATWPAVTTESAAPSVDGVTGTLGSITTAAGTKQLTINGLPVYYFAKDKAPGDVLGQGVNNVWYLVNPAGEMIKPAGY